MTDTSMLDKFDNEIKNKYKDELDKVCKANFCMVPEDIIQSMTAAFSCDRNLRLEIACDYLLGWKADTYILKRTINKDLNINSIFTKMKETYQLSCSSTCISPDHHFEEFGESNKCFPIGKVFEVISHFSPNTANRLLDISLVQTVLKQLKLKEKQELLKVFNVNRLKSYRLNYFKNLCFRSNFEVLLINYKVLKLTDNFLQEESSLTKDYDDYITNLNQNLKGNFSYNILPAPCGNNHFEWEKIVDDLLMRSHIIVAVLTPDVVKQLSSLNMFSSAGNTEHIDSLTNRVNFEAYEESLIEAARVHQCTVWTRTRVSNKLKIGVTFQCDLLAELVKIYPISFVLPKEMKLFLVFLHKTLN